MTEVKVLGSVLASGRLSIGKGENQEAINEKKGFENSHLFSNIPGRSH